jgi:FAD-dependent sensor of blue light
MSDATTGREDVHVFRLMYRSRNVIPPGQRKQELGNLFTAARSNNKGQGITGALLLFEDWFVQVLEGDEAAVRALFAHIERDPRHREVTLRETQPSAPRVFARWAMARVSDDGEPDIPLIAHTDGISPAAGRRTTPEQEELLDVMREAARSAPQAV